MKTGIKIFVNVSLLFSFIGFVTYLFLIIGSFLGCCFKISTSLFETIAIIMIVAAFTVFTFCIYNCIRQKKYTA